MKEKVIATRYKLSTQHPWDLPIQLTRTGFSWDETSGFTMEGTWSGRMPQNGIYNFHWYSKVVSHNRFAQLTTQRIFDRSNVIIMICTFDASGTWQASDWWYNNTIPGILFHKTSSDAMVTIKDGAEVTFMQTLKKWGGSAKFGLYLGNSRFKSYGLTAGQEKTLNSEPDSVFGAVKSFGNLFCCDRDIILGQDTDFSKGSQMINVLSLQTSEIEQGGVYDFNKTAVTLGDDAKYKAMGTVLSGEAKIFINKIDGGAGTNRHAFMTAFAQPADAGIDAEGGLTGYENGVIRTTPLIKNISINQVVHPLTGFWVENSDTTVRDRINNYLVPSKVDFYNKKTTLRIVPLNNTIS